MKGRPLRVGRVELALGAQIEDREHRRLRESLHDPNPAIQIEAIRRLAFLNDAQSLSSFSRENASAISRPMPAAPPVPADPPEPPVPAVPPTAPVPPDPEPSSPPHAAPPTASATVRLSTTIPWFITYLLAESRDCSRSEK